METKYRNSRSKSAYYSKEQSRINRWLMDSYPSCKHCSCSCHNGVPQRPLTPALNTNSCNYTGPTVTPELSYPMIYYENRNKPHPGRVFHIKGLLDVPICQVSDAPVVFPALQRYPEPQQIFVDDSNSVKSRSVCSRSKTSRPNAIATEINPDQKELEEIQILRRALTSHRSRRSARSICSSSRISEQGTESSLNSTNVSYWRKDVRKIGLETLAELISNSQPQGKCIVTEDEKKDQSLDSEILSCIMDVLKLKSQNDAFAWLKNATREQKSIASHRIAKRIESISGGRYKDISNQIMDRLKPKVREIPLETTSCKPKTIKCSIVL